MWAAAAMIVAGAGLASAQAKVKVKDKSETPGELVVQVVDEAGTPIARAKVTGSFEMNRGGAMASFCCSEESLGSAVTGANGRAVLHKIPFTFRRVTVTAARKGWPERTVGVDQVSAGVRIVLGPARAVTGRVEAAGDCPSEFLSVRALPMDDVTAPVDARGEFAFAALPPWAHLSVSACGRGVSVSIEGRPRGERVVLTLPPAAPRQRIYVTQPPPTDWSPPTSVILPLGTPVLPACAQPPRNGLVVAGDFDYFVLEPSCRFLLAMSGLRRTGGPITFTLVRRDGTTLPLGATYLGRTPAIGDTIALVERSEEKVEIIDLATGAAHAEDKIFVAALGAGDTVVLSTKAPRVGSFEALNLEVMARDFQRRPVASGVEPYWTIADHGTDRRSLIYAVRSPASGNSDVHVYDLVAKTDRKIAADASLWSLWPPESERHDGVFVLAAGGRPTHHALATGHVTAAPDGGWRSIGSDLFVKLAKDGGGALWTVAGKRDLRFRWPGFPECPDVRPARISAEYFIYRCENNAVLVTTLTGASRIMAEGVGSVLGERIPPPITGDWLAVSELSGRTLLVSFSGRPARAIGRGTPRWFSSDGRWLAIDGALGAKPSRMTLANVDKPEKNVSIDADTGSWAPDAPIFVHAGTKGPDGPLYATLPDEGRTITIEPRARGFRVLPRGEVMVAVPPGGPHRAGIWSRHIPVPAAR